MYTSFVSDTKADLSGLWAQVQDIHTKQEQNNTVYQVDYAESENARLDEQKKSLCNAARERIGAIMDKASADAATLDAVSPLDISPDETNYRRVMELLSGSFDLSIENLQHIIDEYVGGNRALTNAVGVYCQNHGLRLVRATAESRRSGIREIRASALGIVEKIESSSYRNQGHDLSAPLLVSEFCANSDFASELCGRLGQRFDGTIIPPVVESADENRFNFSFRGVRDEQKAG